MYSGKDDFEEEPDDGRGDDPEDGRGGNGDVAVAKSSVATSSVSTTGLPQEEQKRTSAANSVPQKAQFDMKNSRYRISQTGNLRILGTIPSSSMAHSIVRAFNIRCGATETGLAGGTWEIRSMSAWSDGPGNVAILYYHPKR
jgi:hypothetical protein